jgi:acyl transferase domain-containing protein
MSRYPDGTGGDGPAIEDRIAVLGMAGRFPGAADVDALWRLSVAGESGIVTVGDAKLPGGFYGVLPDTDRFDAGYFRIPAHEAALIDPQQRILLEVVQHAVDDAGLDPAAPEVVTSVYAAAAPSHGHNPAATASGRYEWDLANGVDYVATRLSYRLGLRGEAITVQTACSSSLVAVHLAIQSLLSGQSDLAIAGGVSISADQTGYVIEEGMIASPTGACRPFDVAADGTVPGAGAAAVVLKRLADAQRDGDRVRAVILGSAINNDGATKVGFMAPSPTGQSEVIATAYAVAQVDARTVRYVETHGTATRLGDQVEIEGLRRAFGLDTGRSTTTALGSLKANCGHLDRAAGVSGLIRAVLALEHATIPPMAGCTAANPELDLRGAGFTLPTGASAWPEQAGPRRAGVSAFGVGGTNVHVVLEQAPDARQPDPVPAGTDRASLWLLSAHSAESLRVWSADFEPSTDPADVAAALARRRPWEWRTWRVRPHDIDRPDDVSPTRAAPDPHVVFAFPGQGERVVDGMRDLYDSEPVYRETVDRCAEIVKSLAGWDLRDDLYAPMPVDERAALYVDMSRFQPALFTVEWALGQLWRSWGVRPAAVVGHSIGEVTAAACAGVLTEADALALVVERSRLMEKTPLGATLTVGLPAVELAEFLGNGLELASDNGAELSAVTGPEEAIARIEAILVERDVFRRRLNIRHSPHGSTMAAVSGELSSALTRFEMSPPRIPLAGNVSGDWVGAEIAAPDYWGRQMCSPVRFREQLERVSSITDAVVVVLGPSAGFARMVAHELTGRVAGVVHPYPPGEEAPTCTRAQWLGVVGQAWSHGVSVAVNVLCPDTGRRAPLPPTRFDHTVRWPRPDPAAAPTGGQTTPPERHPDPGAWLTHPTWRPAPADGERRALRWLLPEDAERRAWFKALGCSAEAVDHPVLPPIADVGTTVHPGRVDLLWWPDPDDELLARAAAVADQMSRGDVRLWILESRTRPFESTYGGAFAATRVLPQEFPGIRCNLVQVSEGHRTTEAEAMVGLLSSRLDGAVFRVLGNQLSVQDHQQVWPGWSPRRLRQGGCYLITGGLGRVGQALTHALSRLAQGTFYLIGRRSEADVADQLAGLRDRIGPDSQVCYAQVDVTSRAEVAAYLDRLRSTHGRIDGVLHTAGMTDRSGFRLASDTGPEDFAQTRAAKVEGTLTLAAALSPDDADFVLICSSLSVVLGGVRFGAYVSANAWQDEFARRRHDEGDRRWLSVEWDAWVPTGRSRDDASDEGPLRYALDEEDGYQVIRRVLACDQPVISVSTAPLTERLREVRRQVGADLTGPATGAVRVVTDSASVATAVRNVLSDVLGDVPADDLDLRRSGIESLAILQIVGRLRTSLGVRVSLADAMRALSVTGLTRLVLSQDTAGGTSQHRLDVSRLATDGRVDFPTTPTQRRWLALLPEGYGGIALAVDVQGPVASGRLRDAVKQTIERHSALRTVFNRAFGWTQSVRPAPEVLLTDLTGLSEAEQLRVVGEAVLAAQQKWFDLEHRAPFEVSVFALGPERHVLLIHAHHVLFDGWSSSIFLRDVARAAMLDAALAARPLQYTDYAVALEKWLSGEAFRRERKHWQATFQGAPGPTRLAPRDGDPGAGERGTMLPFEIPRATWHGVRHRATEHGMTPFVLLMSAYSLLVYEETAERDLVIGTTAAGRPTPETEEIVGVFVNPLPIRLRVDPDVSVADYVRHVHDVLIEFHEHGNYPMEDLVSQVSPFVGTGLNDTFYCYLLYQNYWRPDGLGLEFRPLPTPDVHHKLMRDTEIVLVERDDVLAGEFWWRPGRFSEAWAGRSIERFATLLGDLVDESTYQRRLGEISRP